MNLLTRIEEIILLTVYRLEGNAYGVTIRQEIEKSTGRNFSVGAIYVPLERLTRNGLLASYTGEPTAERGGRSKRYYRVTPQGLAALRRVQEIQEAMWTGISDFPSPESLRAGEVGEIDDAYRGKRQSGPPEVPATPAPGPRPAELLSGGRRPGIYNRRLCRGVSSEGLPIWR